jgi:hypothetical protein
MRLFGTAHVIELEDGTSLNTNYSIQTEDIFNSGIMAETRKRPSNRIGNIKMNIKPMTLQKKQDKNFTV